MPDCYLTHLITDTADGLDLSAFHAHYDKDGPRDQSLHPATMLKVLVYEYARGVFSSRKIARTRTWRVYADFILSHMPAFR